MIPSQSLGAVIALTLAATPVQADSYDCLVNLRTQIAAWIEEGDDIMDAPGIVQSGFEYLEQCDSLSGRNVQTTYEQMEWE